MNFKHMPELNWRYGYAFALGLMALTAAGLLLWFRHRGWTTPHQKGPRRRHRL
jgi:magnesium transporter